MSDVRGIETGFAGKTWVVTADISGVGIRRNFGPFSRKMWFSISFAEIPLKGASAGFSLPDT
jgi:hypothetical protein